MTRARESLFTSPLSPWLLQYRHTSRAVPYRICRYGHIQIRAPRFRLCILRRHICALHICTPLARGINALPLPRAVGLWVIVLSLQRIWTIFKSGARSLFLGNRRRYTTISIIGGQWQLKVILSTIVVTNTHHIVHVILLCVIVNQLVPLDLTKAETIKFFNQNM